MKKLIIILCSIIMMQAATAQITLENSAYVDDLYLIRLESSGYKYFNHQIGNTINLYNLNLTLYKQITIPTAAPNVLVNIAYITEALFDTDSSTVEYLYEYRDYNTGQLYTEVLDENGNILLHVDSGAFADFGTDIYSLNYFYGGNANPNRVRNTPNGAKLYLSIEYYTSFWNFVRKDIYALPGWLQCSDCLNPNNPPLAINDNFLVGGSEFATNPFPNPATEYINISYDLPAGSKSGIFILYSIEGKEISRIEISGSHHLLRLPVSHLSHGTYLYRINTSTSTGESRKFVVE